MRKGQSILEYAVLIIAVATAFTIMNVYINRAVNARLHELNLETNPRILVH